MIPLIAINLPGASLCAHGYDAPTQTLAIIEVDSADTKHYLHVPQDVYDGLVAMIAAAENPQPATFSKPTPESPDHYLSRYVKTAYDFTTVTGAAVADLETLEDPTLET